MAKTAVESFKIKLPCPNCSKKTSKLVTWLKTHDEWVCAGCGKTVAIEKRQSVVIEKALKAEQKFRNALRKLGKRLG